MSLLVAATTNEHKIAEFSAILAPLGFQVVSRTAAGVPDFEVEEDGASFEENSLIKARAAFDALKTSAWVVADDSGLEVDALGGAPGVYSARFAGQEAAGPYMASVDGDAADFAAADAAFAVAGHTAKDEGAFDYAAAGLVCEQRHRSRQDLANDAKLLRLLAGVPFDLRTGRFVCAITCIGPGHEPIICRGEAEGHIGFSMAGAAGFGYDPLFMPLGYECSFGMFEPEDKNAISHRGKALALLAEKLKRSDVANSGKQ